MIFYRVLFALCLVFSSLSVFAQSSYGLAETDWRVVDNNPTGAQIFFVSEPLLGKSVVQTDGAGKTNSYLLGGTNATTGWNNTNEFFISWRLQASEAINVYVRVDTTLGWRYLYYNHSTKNNLLNRTGRNIHHGLGADFIDGNWHTWSRDLSSDLKNAEPDNDIIAVNGILLRGNMRIDGVQLNDVNQVPIAVISGAADTVALETSITLNSEDSVDPNGAIIGYTWRDAQGTVLSELTTWEGTATTTGLTRYSLEVTDNEGFSAIQSITTEVIDAGMPTIYSDAEAGDLDGWRLADKTPAGSSIDNVVDPDDQTNKVIQFNSSGIANSFITGYTNPNRGWNNSLQKNISWRSKSDENFRLFVRITTPAGWRYIYYDARATSTLANSKGTYIHHALGTEASNGQWQTHTRDLQADLELAQPGNTILAVHAVVVRGSFLLDDLMLAAAAPAPQPPPEPSVPTNLSPEVNAQIEAGATQSFSWESQTAIDAYDFHLFDKTTGDLTYTYELDPALICSDGQCALEAEITLPVSNDHAWRVRAINESGTSNWSRSIFHVVEPLTSAPMLPIISSPSENSEVELNSPIELQWQADVLANDFNVEIVSLSDSLVLDSFAISAADNCNATICSLSIPNTYPVSNAYQLQLKANNRLGSSDWSMLSFSVAEPYVEPPVIAPVVPVHISPIEGAPISAGATQTFTWEAQSVPVAYDFHLFDRTDGALSFVYDIDPAVACDDIHCSIDYLVNLPILDNHAWRVRAKNTAGISGWSRSVFDVVEPVTEAPAAPVIALPLNNTAFELEQTIELQWQVDELASTYDYGIVNPYTESTSYQPAVLAADVCDASTCSLSITNDLGEGFDYELRLRGNNSVGSSEWSARSFNIVAPEPPSPPVAAFTVSTLTGSAPFVVTVDASGSSDAVGISNYSWFFAEGQTQQGADLVTANHEYLEPGSYPISLSVTNQSGGTDTHQVVVSVINAPPANAPSAQEAARLLAQASFGATTESINAVRSLGVEGWIDAQLSLQGPRHLDHVLTYSNGSNRDARHEAWWSDVVDGEDQLRNRVAFALSQLFVVSDTGFTLANAQYGITNYYDILHSNAFGNYRELLEHITLNPVMGIYLSMLQNDKGDPIDNTRADENFAREVLQLFSIGLYNLNQDGTQATGHTFTQEQIEDFARVFTGWNYKDAGRWDRPLFTGQDLINPMEPYEEHHDTDAKTLLNGVTLPAGQSARADLEQALDNIAAHSNVGPFISTHLIKQLVTSNPSTGYVGRVAAVFNNNGNGVKGDLKATVKAVLMDAEARNPTNLSGYGKLREPVIRLAHLWRAFSITTGYLSQHGEYNTYSPALKNIETLTGQAVLRSPSVFNFYSPDFAPSGPVQDAVLTAPEFAIFTDGNILSTATRLNSQVHRHYKQNPNTIELNPSHLDYEVELALADNPQALLDHLNLLLLSGSMSSELNNLLLSHLTSLPSNEDGLLLRVQDAISLLIASPEYLVQK